MNINEEVHQQQSFLREKRKQFAHQIRSNQRKQIIKERRKQCFPQLMNVRLQHNISKDDFIQFLKMLQENKENDQTQILYKIHKGLINPNSNQTSIISLIVQYGTYYILFQNLTRGKFLMQTLLIFQFIFSKEIAGFSHLFVSQGILIILLQIVTLNIKQISLVLNIIRNICLQDDDYCEILLQTNRFEDLINIFFNIYNNQPDKKNINDSKNILENIIEILDVLVSIEQSDLDFQLQYNYILNFLNNLLRQNICVKSSLAVIYSLALKNSSKVQAVVFSVVNQILHYETGQNPYYQNLLLVVSKFTPGKFNYQQIFQLCLKAKYQLPTSTISILNKVVGTKHANYVIKNELWWKKALTKIDPKKPEFRQIILIIRKLQINFPCIWRLISDYMNMDDTYNSQTTLFLILSFIQNSFIAAMQLKDLALQSFLAQIERNRILIYLLKIYQKKNFTYAFKAEQLIQLHEELKKTFIQSDTIKVWT